MGNLGGGGAKYFFRGPKCPPRRPSLFWGGPPVCLESLGKCQLLFLWSGLLVKRRAREVV